ncbi:MAG: hypothetical protein AAB691_01895 [Patescibacteria group bacterium]
MRGKNRCGAKGSIRQQGDRFFFLVGEIVSEASCQMEGGKTISLHLPIDIVEGDEISLEAIAQEHRGLVVFCGGVFWDEGELEVSAEDPSGFQFVSVRGPDASLSGTGASMLVGPVIELKWEICDQVGAMRRLRKTQSK